MPPDHSDIAVAIAKIDILSSDMTELKASIRNLADSMHKLAVMEERQTTSNESLGRAFKQIEELQARLAVIEQAQPIQQQSSDFVQKAIGYVVAIVLGAIISGLWRSPPYAPDATPPAITGK